MWLVLLNPLEAALLGFRLGALVIQRHARKIQGGRKRPRALRIFVS